MKTSESTPTMCELAPLFALGSMASDERRAFEEHLATGCATCAAELATLGPVASDLVHAAAPRQPRPELRNRVLERITAAAKPETMAEMMGMRFVRSDRVAWEAGSAPGIERKRLFTDPEHSRVTTLIRVAPGASYPAHRHADIEEVYLLEGDLLVCGVLMQAGDYCRAEADTVHQGIWSPSGCVFLATFSEQNERLG